MSDAATILRVMLLVTDLQPGGAPLRLLRTAIALRELGVDAALGSLAGRGPLHAELETRGVPTFDCGARSVRSITALLRLSAHVRRLQPHLIHATLTHANVAARLIGRWTGVPVLTSTATLECERRWHLRLERATARWDRGHVVHGEALAEWVRVRFGVPADRIFQIPWAADPPALPPRAAALAELELPPDACVLAWVGRMDPVKRVHLAIEALARLPESVHLLLVGSGPLEPSLRAQAAAISGQRVHFLGWQRDLGRIWSAADALLLPSLTEGMPNAALEALACGIPVIAADLPSLRELQRAGADVVLVNPVDAAGLAEVAQATLRRPVGGAPAFRPPTTMQAAAALRDVYLRVLRQPR